MALERVGRARVAYKLQCQGWKVGEAYDDGYDLLPHHPERNTTCYIEVKAMDISNRGEGVNLTAPVSAKERASCTHIIVYLEPVGDFFVARKGEILTEGGNIFAAINENAELRTPREESRSFAKFKDRWDQLFL